MKTIFINESDATRAWYVIDATDKPLGRIAAKAASMLRGKTNVSYAPNQNNGDFVVIINAEKVAISGRKAEEKMYYHHTGYVGGLQSVTYNKLMERHPEDPLMLAIRGMLPKGPLGRQLLKNVRIYKGSEHPHIAQNPKVVEL